MAQTSGDGRKRWRRPPPRTAAGPTSVSGRIQRVLQRERPQGLLMDWPRQREGSRVMSSPSVGLCFGLHLLEPTPPPRQRKPRGITNLHGSATLFCSIKHDPVMRRTRGTNGEGRLSQVAKPERQTGSSSAFCDRNSVSEGRVGPEASPHLPIFLQHDRLPPTYSHTHTRAPTYLYAGV